MRYLVQKDKLDGQLKSFSSPSRKGIDLIKKTLKGILSWQKAGLGKTLIILKQLKELRKLCVSITNTNYFHQLFPPSHKRLKMEDVKFIIFLLFKLMI